MSLENKKKPTAKEIQQRYINYLDVFIIPEIWWQPYPTYHVSSRGNMYSLKNILYLNNGKSKKKYTRYNQLCKRSLQAKMFDMLLNIKYFHPLPVVREFPIIIQNHNRLPGMKKSGFYLCDYFFPTALGGKGLAVELDSEYHSEEKDGIRDEYLFKAFGIQTFRLRNFERAEIQKGKFNELCQLLRSEQPSQQPKVFDFSYSIREYIHNKLSTNNNIQLIDLSETDILSDIV